MIVDPLGASRRSASSDEFPKLSSIERPDADATSAGARKRPGPLACRPMVEQDIEPAIVLLAAGFPEKAQEYWRRALERLRDRAVPDGRPRYGYVMSHHERLVGILLLVFSESDVGAIRGNVSSWYVEAAYRGFANLLLAAPLKQSDVTLVNVSPAPTTLDTIEAQGFAKYVGGTVQAVAALALPVPRARVRQVKAGAQTTSRILADHAAWGCLCFEVTYGGETIPFVFAPDRFLGDKLPCALLVYCRQIEEFVRFAGPLTRRLLRLGLLAVMVDAEGPIPGLAGPYRPSRGLRFYRGPNRPRLGDLSYTELAIFGA